MPTTEMRFSDLTTASVLNDDDILALSKVDQTSASGYMSYKATMIAIGLYITKLANYTSDLQTTDKTIIGAINELKQLIALIPQFDIEVVEELPTEDISETTIYMVPSEDPETENAYDEFIYVDGEWEQVGSTAVDLSAYYTKLEVNGLLDLKESKADMEDDVTEILEDLSDDVTVTGNPVTFETINGGMAKSCEVTMNPIQDLHGYDYPWVGGAGKNLAKPYSYSAGIHSYDGNGNVTISGTVQASSYVPSISTGITEGFFITLQAGTYKPSTEIPLPSGLTINVMTKDNRPLSQGSSFTITEETDILFRVAITEAGTYNWTSGLMLEAGSQATDYAPYSNICPISGRDSVDVVVTGKNQFEVTAQSITKEGVTYTISDDGIITANGTVSATASTSILFINRNQTLPAGNYILSGCEDGSSSTYRINVYAGSTRIVSQSSVDTAFTLEEETTLSIRLTANNGYSYNNVVIKPMIRLATETDSSFVPYTKQTKTITFPSTIYGGKLDMVSGKLVSIMSANLKDLGDLTWTKEALSGGHYRFVSSLNGILRPVNLSSKTNILCSALPIITGAESYNYTKQGLAVSNNSDNCFVNGTDYDSMTVEQFTEAVTGFKVIYELREQYYTEITLTPQEIELLKGQNVLFTDGDNIKLVASKLANVPDLLTYIQSLEARIKALEEA